jgi:hypothetical protein
MAPAIIFNMQLVLGYAAWLLCFAAYGWPRLKAMDRAAAMRAIAALQSFRFFGLAFAFHGLVGAGVPAGFAVPAAGGDLAAGILAMLALASFRSRPLFWLLAVAFNVVGAADLVIDYYHAVRLGLPEVSAGLGPMYAIPMLYVPVLMITHAAAFVLMGRALLAPSVDAAPARASQPA